MTNEPTADQMANFGLVAALGVKPEGLTRDAVRKMRTGVLELSLPAAVATIKFSALYHHGVHLTEEQATVMARRLRNCFEATIPGDYPAA